MTKEQDSVSVNFAPGDTIAGYRLEEQIGQGGMAVVYRARDERLRRPVALKVLSPDLASDAEFRTRFIRESRAAAAVDHPNIIPVYDAGEVRGFLFIAMRYVPGGDVRSLLADGRGLEPGRAWKLISQIASALDAAHQHGLIHRDVKPANMLLENDHVYLSDFGISRLAVTSHLTTAGQLVGTLDYIAPESIKSQPIDGRADQYSLACTAFELLTGHPPFHADLGLAVLHAHVAQPPPAVTRECQELPPAVDLIIAKGMAKRADDRYASCTAFSSDLGKALGETPGVPVVGVAAGQQTAAPGRDGSPGEPSGLPRPATQLAAPAARTPTELAGQVPGLLTPPPHQPQQILIPRQTPPPHQTPPPQQTPAPHQMPPPQQTPPPQPVYVQGGWPVSNQWTPPPGYPPGFSGPSWTSPYPPAPSPSRGNLVAVITGTIAILIAAITGVAVVFHFSQNSSSSSTPGARISTPASPAPGQAGTEAAEASAINTLITRSVATVAPLQGLTVDVSNCQDVSYDYSRINSITTQRASQIEAASKLNVGAIPAGPELKSDLISALKTSLQADQDYVSWASSQASDCTPGFSSPDWQAAYEIDLQTDAEKKVFLAIWSPIAARYGYPQSPQF